MKPINNYIVERIRIDNIGKNKLTINEPIEITGMLEWTIKDAHSNNSHTFKSDDWYAGVWDNAKWGIPILLFWTPDLDYVPYITRVDIKNYKFNPYPWHLSNMSFYPKAGKPGFDEIVKYWLNDESDAEVVISTSYARSIIPVEAMDLVHQFEKMKF